MASYIQLLKVNKQPDAKAHPYPYQIWIQAIKLIQGSVYYSAFVDVAVGDYVRTVPNAYSRVEAIFLKQGVSKNNLETSWECFQEFLNLFPSPVFQYSLYSMVIHWDWFVSRLGSFVYFARQTDNTPPMEIKREKRLQKIGIDKLEDQIALLEEATGIAFQIESKNINLIKEMILVRNLGMHNEWEVDQFYIDRTSTTGWQVGQLRRLTADEITCWEGALLSVLPVLAKDIGKRYVAIPAFP